MFEIHLDGKRLETGKNSTLGDILPEWDQRCCVGVIRPVELESAETRNIKFFTTAGEVVVEIAEDAAPHLFEGVLSYFSPDKDDSSDLKVGWSDRYSVAFGPFSTEIVPGRTASSYRMGDLIIGCGGYDPRRSFLIFAKMNHHADHGAPEGGGIIGSVVSGHTVLSRWSPDDMITGMERLVSWADQSNSFTTNDRDLILEDGMRVISYVRAVADGYTPAGINIDVTESVEHMLLAFQDGCFWVGRATSTHVRDEKMAPSDVLMQKKRSRLEGTITVRTKGKSRGAVYIYTKDVPSSPFHTVVGSVEHGIELVKLAGEQDVFHIVVEPPRLDLLGLTLEEARELASERGIQLDIDKDEGARVIVGQDPGTTLEVLQKNTVRLETRPLEDVIDIELDDAAAPRTCEIFRDATGLRIHRIGIIPFFFNFDDVYLFKPLLKIGTKINLENIPEGEVPACSLAMTNDSRKGAGIVGIRTSDNSEFGPTSEPLGGTNIIGRVIQHEKLARLKEGEPAFFREVRK